MNSSKTGLIGYVLLYSIIGAFLLIPPSLAAANSIVDIEQITDEKMEADLPAWSPDKKWLAFSNIRVVDGSEQDELWIIEMKSKKMRKLLGNDELKGYGVYGYSLWDIKWKDDSKLTFFISDNDVGLWSIELNIGSPEEFKATERMYDEYEPMPDDLKAFLKNYYKKGSERKKNLDKYPIWYHKGYIKDKWYVQYLRDREFLIIDLKKNISISSSFSTDDIGDNLEFKTLNNKPVAVYPDYNGTGYYVDNLESGKTAQLLFKVKGYPNFKDVGNGTVYVYPRTRTSHPFYRTELFMYKWGGTIEKIRTDNWHNLSISDDGKDIAFIKVIGDRRVLFRGKIRQGRPPS
ncbi:MAG: hypothetical protein JSV21_04915 [Nitrospirota bacterium]|nr:MAG: hypothetical protein JSV21_04915 [Nitrospirota bacterium]